MRKFLLLISLAASSYLYAQSLEITKAEAANRTDKSSSNYVLSHHSAIAQAAKSVVNISAIAPASSTADQLMNQMDEFFSDPFFQHFFGMRLPDRPERSDKRFGSGVIISSDGYVITNNHLVENASKITVTIGDEQLSAKLIGTDSKTDVALIKIEEKELKNTSLPAIAFADSDSLLVGDVVFAIGNPFGVGESISSGIISALNKNNIGLNQYEDFIQTDAAINPGNSGGALVDSRGALIGINSAIITRSGGANGIGFAIPANMAKDIALQLAANGKITRGFLGILMADFDGDIKKTYNNQKGALISKVIEGEAAAQAGLKRGDLIIAVDGNSVKDYNELRNLIGKKQPGESIKLQIERDKKLIQVQVKLGKGDEQTSENSSLGSVNSFGLQLENTKDNAGAKVLKVQPDSKAHKAGIAKGDVIIGLNSTDVKTPQDFDKAIEKAAGKYVKIWLQRGNINIVVVINKEAK